MKQPRRTQHGIVCKRPGCGSSRVIIIHTRTRRLRVERESRQLLRRQHCKCNKCGHLWWRTLRIEETETS